MAQYQLGNQEHILSGSALSTYLLNRSVKQGFGPRQRAGIQNLFSEYKGASVEALTFLEDETFATLSVQPGMDQEEDASYKMESYSLADAICDNRMHAYDPVACDNKLLEGFECSDELLEQANVETIALSPSVLGDVAIFVAESSSQKEIDLVQLVEYTRQQLPTLEGLDELFSGKLETDEDVFALT